MMFVNDGLFRNYELMWAELRSELEERIDMKAIEDGKESDPKSFYLYTVLKMMDNIEYCDA